MLLRLHAVPPPLPVHMYIVMPSMNKLYSQLNYVLTYLLVTLLVIMIFLLCPEVLRTHMNCNFVIHNFNNYVTGLPKNFKLERIVEILSPSERAEIQRTTASKRRRRCHLHTHKYLEYYCNSCKGLACGDCLVEKHMNHNVQRASEVLPQHVNALQALIPGATKALEDGTASLAMLQAHSDSLQKQGAEATREIEAYFDKIRKILSQRETELKDEVKVQVKEGQEAIERNQLSLQTSVKDIQRCKEKLGLMTTTHKNSVDVLAEENQLVSKLENSRTDLEAHRKVTDHLQTLSIQPPSLKSPRLEALLKTLAAKSPVPLPRRRCGPVTKEHFRVDRTASTLSDGYAIAPDFKRTEEAVPSDDEEDPPDSLTLFPPTPPLRRESHDFNIEIVEPTLIHGPRNLSNTFFRNPTEAIFPCGVCCGPSNTIIVTDVRNHCFRILTFTGKCLDVVGREGKSDGMFGEPTAVAVDKEGNLLVCDLSPARVQKFTPQGRTNFLLCGQNIDQFLLGCRLLECCVLRYTLCQLLYRYFICRSIYMAGCLQSSFPLCVCVCVRSEERGVGKECSSGWGADD